ncbi:hypothetical protein GQ55_7G286300 [Panicum hallii var. hallii]|uniref:Coenzyme Q-binding protein COQ10 START domain-containing protein n=1 Tax=Panicum hallii var. hallii TaxID=1504633 RepID=A0A2T7D031_9POAL|nr:hypothetical protein GQ55_7G286300 [Panicum hallii var. hallii]PUZ48950.1 hypothetical protein GQ55_7G286300 [Panicum hallii var. hallii]
MQEASRLPSDSAPRLAKSTPPIQRESGPALPSLASRVANSMPPSARLRSRRRSAPSARRHPSSPLAALDVTPATPPPNRAAHRPVVPLWDPASMASGAGRSVLARRRGVVGECGGLGRGECAEPDADPLDEVADLGGPLAPRAAPDALVLRRLPAAARHRRGLLLLIPRRLHPRLPGLSERRFLDQAHGFTRLYEDMALGFKFNAKCYEGGIAFQHDRLRFQVFQGKWSVEEQEGGDSYETTLSYLVELEPKPLVPVRLVDGRICSEIKYNLVSI